MTNEKSEVRGSTFVDVVYDLVTRHWPLVAFLSSALMLAIAHAFETFGHLAPCHLCLKAREVYWVAGTVGLIGAVLQRTPLWTRLRQPVNLLLGAIFLYGTGLAVFHAGVEWKWWPGPTTCTGSGAASAAKPLGHAGRLAEDQAADVRQGRLGVSGPVDGRMERPGLAEADGVVGAGRPAQDGDAVMTRPIPSRPGQGALSSRLAEMLRVDQAGELAAVHIYRGQAAVMRAAPGRERITAQLMEMEGHEQVHLSRFNELLTERKVRPTLMSPVWRAAAFALGAGTALLGDKAAHACTEAVETVIEKHYAGQIEELKDRDPALAAELTQFPRRRAWSPRYRHRGRRPRGHRLPAADGRDPGRLPRGDQDQREDLDPRVGARRARAYRCSPQDLALGSRRLVVPYLRRLRGVAPGFVDSDFFRRLGRRAPEDQ